MKIIFAIVSMPGSPLHRIRTLVSSLSAVCHRMPMFSKHSFTYLRQISECLKPKTNKMPCLVHEMRDFENETRYLQHINFIQTQTHTHTPHFSVRCSLTSCLLVPHSSEFSVLELCVRWKFIYSHTKKKREIHFL